MRKKVYGLLATFMVASFVLTGCVSKATEKETEKETEKITVAETTTAESTATETEAETTAQSREEYVLAFKDLEAITFAGETALTTDTQELIEKIEKYYDISFVDGEAVIEDKYVIDVDSDVSRELDGSYYEITKYVEVCFTTVDGDSVGRFYINDYIFNGIATRQVNIDFAVLVEGLADHVSEEVKLYVSEHKDYVAYEDGKTRWGVSPNDFIWMEFPIEVDLEAELAEMNAANDELDELDMSTVLVNASDAPAMDGFTAYAGGGLFSGTYVYLDDCNLIVNSSDGTRWGQGSYYSSENMSKFYHGRNYYYYSYGTELGYQEAYMFVDHENMIVYARFLN